MEPGSNAAKKSLDVGIILWKKHQKMLQILSNPIILLQIKLMTPHIDTGN